MHDTFNQKSGAQHNGGKPFLILTILVMMKSKQVIIVDINLIELPGRPWSSLRHNFDTFS
jgi:hypothetical protein